MPTVTQPILYFKSLYSLQQKELNWLLVQQYLNAF